MARFFVAPLLIALLAFALSVTPTSAAGTGGQGYSSGTLVAPAAEPSAGAQGDVVPVALWTFLAVMGAGVVGGVLYLFKRRIGAFPRNPAWVAPITIMRSADAPDEGAFGEVPADGHSSHH